MSNNAIANKPRFSVAIQTDNYQKLINDTLRDPKRIQRFIASITSAVAVSPALQDCTPHTILTCALLGEALELSPSPQLGQYYLVPFKDNKNNVTNATFILGYKGYIQLAIRSGQYKKLNVMAIKKGELIRYDALNEEIEVSLIQDELEREITETIGYYAMFEYVNGFKKALYWSKEKMLAHASKYSAAFSVDATTARDPRYSKVSYADYIAGNIPKGTEWLYSSFWYKDFDGMAYKTMIRQLISKWGIMSVEMRQAVEADERTINRDMTPDYLSGADIPSMYDDVKSDVADIRDADNVALPQGKSEQAVLSMSDL